MDKDKLINLLAGLIQDVCAKDFDKLVGKDGKIKFRQYPLLTKDTETIRAIDVTIEF